MDEGTRLLFFGFFLYLSFLYSYKTTQSVVSSDTFIGPREIVDLEALSFDKLKTILRTRGFHEEYSEKWQMVEHVQMTGMAVEEDLEEDLVSSTYVPKYILDESDLSVRFDNLNESIWLVRILHPNGRSSRKEAIWSSIEPMMAVLGVWAGTLECSDQFIRGLCSKWMVEGMGLALLAPSDYQKRATYHTTFPKSKGALLRWMTKTLDSLEPLNEEIEPGVAESWVQDTAFHVLYITDTSAKPPLFFTMLGARFNHGTRIHFGYLTNFKGSSLGGMKIPRFPAYVVSASGQQHLFGSRNGERLSFRSMEAYLLSNNPGALWWLPTFWSFCSALTIILVSLVFFLSVPEMVLIPVVLVVLGVLALSGQILAWFYQGLAMSGLAKFFTVIFFVGLSLVSAAFRKTEPAPRAPTQSDIPLPSSTIDASSQRTDSQATQGAPRAPTLSDIPLPSSTIDASSQRTDSQATQGTRVTNINQSRPSRASLNRSPPPSQVEHEPTPSTSQADLLQMLDASFTRLIHVGGPSLSVERRHMIITHRFIQRYIAEMLQETGELSCMQDLKIWTCVRHCPGCSGLEETGDCSCQRGAKGGYCADITVRGRWEASAVEPDGIDFSIAECAICLFDFSYHDTLCTLPCRHTFHWSGIHRWLVDRSNQLRCPMCRKSCGNP